MRKILTLLLATAIMMPAIADEFDAKREEVKQYFISDEEPKVKDAIWTNSTTFKVGVRDDGTKRDGYAQYVCLELYSRGFKGQGVLVRVVDIDKLVKTGEWINLGTAKCE